MTYAVIFRATINKLDKDYDDMVQQLRKLAFEQYNCQEFIAYSEGNEEIAVSYWQSLGDIANWKIPGKMVKGMGGAMDLVASAENIIVAMMHTNRAGASKLLSECSLPLTGVKCVKKIVTNLAVLEIRDGAFHLLERAPGVSVQEIQEATGGTLVIPEMVPEMNL